LPLRTVVSSTYSKTRQAQGSLIKIEDVQKATPPANFRTIYTALSATGHTQILACTSSRDPKNGSLYIYLSGSTSGTLFGTGAQNVTTGLQQVFIARLDPNGKVLAGTQFNSDGRSEYGMAMSISQDSSNILVTVNSVTADGLSSRALLYHLNPISLAEVAPRTGVTEYGGNSYIDAQSMAVSPTFTSSTRTSAVFIAGSASIIPSQYMDIFCHSHVQVGGQLQSVAVYGKA
jgi:hypothetical protein